MTQVSIKTPNLEPTRKALKNIFAEINKARQAASLETAQAIQEKMQEPGEPPTYPINWDSEKQRRAFFATNGFGGGIPHKRTGKYVKSWIVIRVNQNKIIVRNRSRATPFVAGDAFGVVHSRIHKGRWRLLKPTYDAEMEKLKKERWPNAAKKAIHDQFSKHLG